VEDAEILLREMRLQGLEFVSRRVDSSAVYEEALTSFAPDLILSDYTLPGFDGIDALQVAKLLRPDTPFIFVSGTIGEERAIQALKQGAVDYVLKENRARLVPAIERALRDAEEREARRCARTSCSPRMYSPSPTRMTAVPTPSSCVKCSTEPSRPIRPTSASSARMAMSYGLN
jgi:DNA-binding NtrC family response regulator